MKILILIGLVLGGVMLASGAFAGGKKLSIPGIAPGTRIKTNTALKNLMNKSAIVRAAVASIINSRLPGSIASVNLINGKLVVARKARTK